MKEAASCPYIVFRAAVAAGAILSVFHNAFADIPASAYIQNGLIAQWDGIDNAGTGTHDPNATTWKELKGDLATVATALTFRDGKSAYFNGTSGSGTLITGSFPAALEAIRSGAFTAEVYFKPLAYTQYAGIFHFGVNGTHRYFSLSSDINATGGKGSVIGAFQYKRDSWNAANCYSGAIASLDECHHVGCFANGNNHTIIVDGETISTHSAGTLANYSTTDFQIGKYANNNPRQKMDLFGIRLYNRVLSADEIACNANIDKIRFDGADPEALTWPEGWQFEDGSLFKNVKIRVRCGSGEDGYGKGGTISISGGEALTGTAILREYNSSAAVQLSATAAEGYEFVGWLGVPEDIKYNAEIETAIFEDVTAVFRSISEADPREYTWVGESGGVWDDSNNWQDADGFAGVPAAGDIVTVPSWATVTLTNSTSALAAIEVSGTIVFTNWMTRLSATSVTVNNGGVITCAGPFITGEMSNRVWVACGDLTVLRGGRIHADKKGYDGGNTVHKDGYGPGAIPGRDYIAGGGHGGLGSYRTYNGPPRLAVATNEYGSASAPVTPGSGGWGGNGAGGAGGGVVTIEASGCVAVYGSVSADAEGSVSGDASAGGAGGSVFITCKTFQGAYGRISAKGGAPNKSYSRQYHTGGGGRVAVLFDKTEQEKLPSPCPEGMYYGADTGEFVPPDRKDFMDCFPGSLYFSSDTLIDRNGASLVGKLDFADVTDKWTVDSIRLTNGWVMMARDDVEVEVTGDFEVTGDTLVTRRYNASTGKSNDATRGTRWDVGGATLYFATNALHIYRKSSAAPRLTIGGDMKINDYGLLYVYSSEDVYDPAANTPATTNLGAKIDVAGAIVLENIGKMYLKSHPRTGASPSFTAASLTVDATSWIDANDKGFFGTNSSDYNKTCTRTVMPSATGKDGGSHGGVGGNGETSLGLGGPAAYDSLEWPVLCGGGANSNYQRNFPGLGGGVIRFFVTGEAKIDGVLRANSTAFIDSFCGGSAGGTVLVSCDRFSGSGSLQAKGYRGYRYSTTTSSDHNGGGGGGGRIAIHYNPQSQSNVTCLVTFDVSGGAGVVDGLYTGSGEPGTIWCPDDSIAVNGKSHSGSLYVPGLINWAVYDSLTVENALSAFEPGGYVKIENDLVIRGKSAGTAGFEVPQGYFHVGGNLIIEKGHVTVTGDNANPRADRFKVGGDMILDNAFITVECADEDRDQVVSIGGSVVMTNASHITLKPPCDETEGEPGLSFTARKLTMFKDCWIYPWAHNTNGASVIVKIPEISCATNSGFNANGKGYGRTTSSGLVYAPKTTVFNGAGIDGGNAYGTTGSGHGGDGGSAKAVGETYPRGAGLAFDDRRRPVFAGPGGTGTYGGNVPPRGGGVIRIESTFFDLGGGTLTANGSGGVSFRSGGAGGSIYLIADRFFGNGGTLSAKGGAGGYYGFGEKIGNHRNYCMQGGGGGRIAVYFKNGPAKAMNVTASAAGGNCPLNITTCLETYETDVTEMKAERDGKEGTIYWGGLRGMRVIVR